MEQVSSEPTEDTTKITLDSMTDLTQKFLYQKKIGDMESLESSKKIWNVLCGIFVTLKWICITIIVPLLSFSISSFQEHSKMLSYLTGCASLGGAAFERMGIYCSNNSKHCTTKLTELQNSLGVNDIKVDTSFIDTSQLARSRQVPIATEEIKK